jgi:hypothetical protein
MFFLEVARGPVLGVAVAAVDRPALGGLERYFCFFPAVCAGRLVHLPRPAAEAAAAASAAEIPVSHVHSTPTRADPRIFFLASLGC